MTTLTLNEIRIRAAAFAKEFADAHRENAESQIFWHEFFKIFDLPKRCPPTELAKLKLVKARVNAVRIHETSQYKRTNSKTSPNSDTIWRKPPNRRRLLADSARQL